MAIERTQLNLRVSFITIFIKLTIWCNSHTECFLCEGKIYIIILHNILTHKDLSTCIHFILFYQSLFPTEWLQGIALCSGYRVVSLATWNNSIRVIALLSYDLVSLRHHRRRFLNPRQLHLLRGLNLRYWPVNVPLEKEWVNITIFSLPKIHKNMTLWQLYRSVNVVMYCT